MNKDVIVITQREENIKKIKTIFELAGYIPFFVDDLNSAFDMIEKFMPLAVIIVMEDDKKTNAYIKQFKTYLPIIPVIVFMSEKKHTIRDQLLLEGAYAVVEFPWTEVELARILSSIEIRNIENKDVVEKKTFKIKEELLIIAGMIAVFLLSILLSVYFLNQGSRKQETDNSIVLPSANISGFFYKEDNIYFYDWTVQMFYIFSTSSKKIISTKNFFTPYIITTVKDSGYNFFFAITDTGDVKKFLKDEKFSEVFSFNNADIIDLCFDGMYIWSVEDKSLVKRMDNNQMVEIERYSLDFKPLYIACNKSSIFYLTSDGKIIKALLKNPKTPITSTPLPYRISAIGEKDNNILYIVSDKQTSIVKEVKISNVF